MRIGHHSQREVSITRVSERNSFEIGAHRPVIRRLGRAEIHQEHADPPGLDRRVILRQADGAILGLARGIDGEGGWF